MRISEMLELTRFNVDIKKGIITGGVKTDAGKDRVIRIHPNRTNKYLPGPGATGNRGIKRGYKQDIASFNSSSIHLRSSG